MNKILIIGQAPPAVKQTVPYDTTLLYEIFSWVGIGKGEAQEMFEFEAVSNKFPGHGVNGHLKPSTEEINYHFKNVLRQKILDAEKIIVLGNIAKTALLERGIISFKNYDNLIYLPHPSRRNYSLIMNQKKDIIKRLEKILYPKIKI